MARNAWRTLPFLMAMLALGGCRQSTPVEPFRAQDTRGEVDKGLPAEMQAKQRALIELLGAIQGGTPFKVLPARVANVRFEESQAAFYEETPQLVRWAWDGPPKGDEFSVKLTMFENKTGLPTVVKSRVYLVKASGDRFVIRRKQTKE